MNQEEFLKKVKQAARRDMKNRRDHRYLKVMGFLLAKGLLYTNQKIPCLPNAKIDFVDALWAGQNVEPRILEVLPAAMLRFKNHFNYDPDKNIEIRNVLHALKYDQPEDFYGIPFEKLKPWLDIKLKDGRTKKMNERKITKTFRLKPSIVKKIAEIKKRTGQSAAEIIEDLVEAG